MAGTVGHQQCLCTICEGWSAGAHSSLSTSVLSAYYHPATALYSSLNNSQQATSNLGYSNQALGLKQIPAYYHDNVQNIPSGANLINNSKQNTSHMASEK
jgi:hypothetical protein